MPISKRNIKLLAHFVKRQNLPHLIITVKKKQKNSKVKKSERKRMKEQCGREKHPIGLEIPEEIHGNLKLNFLTPVLAMADSTSLKKFFTKLGVFFFLVSRD